MAFLLIFAGVSLFVALVVGSIMVFSTVNTYGCSFLAACGFKEQVWYDSDSKYIYHTPFRPFRPAPRIVNGYSDERNPIPFEQAVKMLTVKDHALFVKSGRDRGKYLTIKQREQQKDKQLDQIESDVQTFTDEELHDTLAKADASYADNPDFYTALYNAAEEELIRRNAV